MNPLTAAFVCGFQPPQNPVVYQPEVRPTVQVGMDRMALPGAELVVRDVEGVPNLLETEHFALWWGDAFDVPDLIVDSLAADLEASWDAQVDGLGWDRPVGTEAFKVNAYVGNSDPDGPTIDFAGGYVTLDDDGIPYVVISPEVLNQYYWAPAQPLRLVQHEFNHILQLGEPGLYLEERAQFYYEASANWMAGEATGDPEEYAEWGGYLLQPHFAVHAFGNLFDDSDRRSGRQYLAGMYVQYLADRFGPDLIWRSWDQAPGEGNPLDWLDRAIEEDLRDVFLDFAVSHAVGDHDLAQDYARGASRSARAGAPIESILAWVPPEGGEGRAMGRQRPEGSSWSRVVYAAPTDTRVTFAVEPDEEGSFGSTSGFVNVAVVERAGAFERIPFEEEVAIDVQAGDMVHFVMVSLPEDYANEERFGFDWRLDVEPEGGGCGCSSSPWPSLTDLLARRRL